MKSQLTGILTCALVCLATLSSTFASDLDSKVWHSELKKAHVLAKSEQKPMLIVFGATWCKFCKKLEKETFSQPEMQSYVEKNFIPVHLDLDEERAIGKILEVKSLPCTVVLSPSADLLGKVVGYKDVETMKSQLDKALKTQNVLMQASQDKTLK